MLACVDQSASLPSSAVERSAAFPGLVGVTGFEPATPTSRKMSRRFLNFSSINEINEIAQYIKQILLSRLRSDTPRYSQLAAYLSPR